MALDTDTNPDPLALGSSFKPSVQQWNSIGFKIMLANMVALLVLGLGVVMFSEYRRSVVYTELSLLEDEARVWALFLSDAHPDELKSRFKKLMDISPRDVTFFDKNGQVVFEKRRLNQYDIHRNPDREDVKKSLVTAPLAQFILMLFPVTYDLPVYSSVGGKTLDDYPAMMGEGLGDVMLNAWSGPVKGLIYTAAVPVVPSEQGRVSGTLLLVKTTTETDVAFQMARFDVVRILLAALAITLALTLYVAFMVARPLNRLARAAQELQTSPYGHGEIPDLSARGDEIGALSLVLRQTTRALRDRLDAIERFAADVAHELKNPLTSLRSALETLPRLTDVEKQTKLLSIMNDDTKRLDRLITDISHLSRLDSDLVRVQPEAVDLTDVFYQVLRAYTSPDNLKVGVLPSFVQADLHEVGIEIYGDHGLPFVVGVPGRLQQVFANLIGNALSFSPLNGRIVIRFSSRDRFVTITIEDQGPGIPESKLETIFTRFYSERPAREEFGTHSGLGLSIARQIVQSVGGRIWAENRLDVTGHVIGARFLVTLPIAG